MSPILSSATLAGMTHIGTILCRVAYGGQGKKVGVIATELLMFLPINLYQCKYLLIVR